MIEIIEVVDDYWTYMARSIDWFHPPLESDALFKVMYDRRCIGLKEQDSNLIYDILWLNSIIIIGVSMGGSTVYKIEREIDSTDRREHLFRYSFRPTQGHVTSLFQPIALSGGVILVDRAPDMAIWSC